MYVTRRYLSTSKHVGVYDMLSLLSSETRSHSPYCDAALSIVICESPSRSGFMTRVNVSFCPSKIDSGNVIPVTIGLRAATVSDAVKIVPKTSLSSSGLYGCIKHAIDLPISLLVSRMESAFSVIVSSSRTQAIRALKGRGRIDINEPSIGVPAITGSIGTGSAKSLDSRPIRSSE